MSPIDQVCFEVAFAQSNREHHRVAFGGARPESNLGDQMGYLVAKLVAKRESERSAAVEFHGEPQDKHWRLSSPRFDCAQNQRPDRQAALQILFP